MAMVKAESYGAGSEEIGIFLQEEGVDYFGVAYLTEAIALRKRGITIPILVMNIDADFDLAIKYQVEVLIYSKRQLNQFIKVLEKKQIKSYPIQLKVETGMYRLGFTYDEVVSIMPVLNSEQIELKAIMSHLRASDEVIDKSHVNRQIDQFEAIYELFSGEEIERHILNTSGILNYSSYQYDMVRIGIGLLGIDPSDSFSKGLIPALNIHAKLIQVKAIKTGDYIGYGIANRAKKRWLHRNY
jgi:alanine racemase